MRLRGPLDGRRPCCWAGGGVRRTTAGASIPASRAAFALRVRVEPFEKSPDDQGAFDDLTADLNNYSNQFAQIIVGYELIDSDATRSCPKVQAGHDSQLSHGLRRRIHPPARTKPAMAIRPDVPRAGGRPAHAADSHDRASRYLAPGARSALGRHPGLRGRGQQRFLSWAPPPRPSSSTAPRPTASSSAWAISSNPSSAGG